MDDVGAGGAGERGGVVAWRRLHHQVAQRAADRPRCWPGVKSVGASLKVKVMVAVLAARLTSLLLTSTEAVGVTVSTVKGELVAPVPALPLFSCQELSTLTEAVEMSVPVAPVKVAV